MLTFRRLLACAFLTSALSLSFAACSDDSGDDGDNTEEPDADTGGGGDVTDAGTEDPADACEGHFCA